MKPIESSQNQHFKIWKSLLGSRGVKKHQLCLVSGAKVTADIISNKNDIIEALLVPCNQPQPATSEAMKERTYALSDDLFGELDAFGTKTALLVCKTPNIQSWQPSLQPTGLELLLPLGDPANLGACIRSAAAFGINKVILLKEASHPFHIKSSRSASGNNFYVDYYLGPSVEEVTSIKNLVILDMNGQDIKNYQWSKNTRLLIGDEGPGVPSKLRDTVDTISVPMHENTESLNATVAAAIAMYSYRGQHS